MRLLQADPNIRLAPGDGDGPPRVVLAFPYDVGLVAAVRTLPGRRFDWASREWLAPADDWVAVGLRRIRHAHPELTATVEVDEWLARSSERWIGHVRTAAHAGRGWWALDTLAGTIPPALGAGAVELDPRRTLIPMTPAHAATLAELGPGRLTHAAVRCIDYLERGETPPGARLTLGRGVAGERFALETLWDHDAHDAFVRLPGSRGGELRPDPWIADELDAFVARHGVAVAQAAAEALAALVAEHRAARRAIAASRRTAADPLPALAGRLGGEPAPFQWAAVRYALQARRCFLADEQGLGKTIEALVALEADGAFPAIVVCPASLKLNWEREAARWLPHRTLQLLAGRSAVLRRDAEITILNYEIVAALAAQLARRRPRALVIDESHLVKNPQAKRTQAVRRLAAAIAPDGLKLALTGTPVLNHADELIAQLRVIDRLGEFGSGASFRRQFEGPLSEERLHWHLRRHCFVRRTKAEVLPQLPAKRQVVVPVALTNEAEYRRAEADLIEWLRSQPLDLSVLEAKVAAARRAERLAQLTALGRLAARGKLAAALAWIHDFLASGEPLVVFARHHEVQHAVLARFPHAAHILGEDPVAARQRAVDAFQEPDGPPLIVCATRVAGQGITLTRSSNVCFLELEWTPALHDQAEDRCHRIGQRDAVTAWYLLAAETIDETMARLIQRKRQIVSAVTDGGEMGDAGLVEGVVRELRDGRPFRHLRAVAGNRGT